MKDGEIRYSDVVGVRITEEDGNSRFIPYNAALKSGLVSSGEDLANMRGPRYAFKDFQGAYSGNPANAALSASIKMDDNGKITVTVPEEWQNDEEVKNYIDDYRIEVLSKNYKKDKDVKYQDPYDETKQITTEEYIEKLNEGLKFRITALAATAPTVEDLIKRYGGSDEKNKAISGLTANDIVTMSAKFDEDDSWVPIPAYMLLAYPQLQQLETYTNGWVQKKDYLDNFYNIESGKITEANAYGITTTPEKMLSEVEDMTPEEIAKTVAFGNFISQVDPKRSNWQQFLQAGDALHSGWTAGTYDWFVETSDLLVNLANFSWLSGNSIETRDFWNGLVGTFSGRDEQYDVSAGELKKMQDMAYTNKDALSKAQSGYMQGRLAGQAVDTVVALAAVGELSKALSNAITKKITEKGAEKLAVSMAEGADYGAKATDVADLGRLSNARISTAADMEKLGGALSKVATGSANYKLFFSQTWTDAVNLYTKALGGTTAMLQAMGPAQMANIVNSASRIATTASFANTAVNVLGTMVIAAVVGNKELTTKVLSGKGTSDTAKMWIQQVMWDAAKITALSYGTNLAVNSLAKSIYGTEAGAQLEALRQKASQKITSFTEKIEHPWLTFIKWYANNRAAAGKVSNAGATQAEAIKEAVLANEARAYGVNLSTETGSYGIKILEEELAKSGAEAGVTMSETLDNLARAGVVLDPANLNLSEYQAWQAEYVGLRNALTNFGDVRSNISRVVHEFTNPDIYPTISQQMSEINKANSDLLKAEQAQGLLSKEEIAKNKGYLKQDEGYIYAMHSPELARYIVRGYELKVVSNEGRMLGHENLNEYEPYKEALARYQKASESLSEEIRNIADTRYVPALTKAESNILDVMVDAGVYPEAFVKAMRSNGKFGKNGEDWMRLVARKETPKGAYVPFSKMVKEDNTLSINRFRILDDKDITWPGNGLQQLIEEYGTERADKDLVKKYKAATGKTTEVVISGEKTRSAGVINEYKDDFIKSVKQGFKSFTQTVGGTVAIGRARSAEQEAFVNEVATTGGIETIDIDTLRGVMQEKGVPMAESIVDQETLNKFLAESSDEAKKILLDVVGENPLDALVYDYQEDLSPEILAKREKIDKVEKELKQLEKDSADFYAGLGWKGKKIPNNVKGEKRDYLKKYKQDKIDLGKRAAKRMGFTGKTEEEFVKFYEKKRAALETEKETLSNEVSKARGSARDTIVFDGDLYPETSSEYIPYYKSRQEISDKYLGKFMSEQGGLADEWLNDGSFEKKAEIREKIEKNPELRTALLSTMYSNSGSKLPYEEWLDTPITLKRQQLIDSLRPEDAFLSFSMRDDWQGISSVVPQQQTIIGDIISLEIKPKNTLGEIPKGTKYEDATELEVLVPREAYATAMSNYDKAIAKTDVEGGNIGELTRNIDELKRSLETMKDEIVERSPKTNAEEVIPELSYKDRKALAQEFVDRNRDYVLLYRMQGGKPDKWRPNNRGKAGKFEGDVGELKGAVWLTSDPDWVEGPERATAGVNSKFSDGVDVTDDNIVVIPVKKSDILDNTYDGGEEYKNDTVLRKKIEDSGKKLIQTRVTESDEAIEAARKLGVAPRYRNHAVPNGNSKTEFILFEQDHPEVLSDGMELMLQEYNREQQYDGIVNKKAIRNLERDIKTTEKAIEEAEAERAGLTKQLLDALRNEQYNNLSELKATKNSDYEALLNKLDRANAKANDGVKKSAEVQVAADEYRKNVKNFEDSVIFNQKFSYLIKSEATKNTFQAFAADNGLELPEGKGSVKSKVKSLLWDKISNGEELPSIKGLKKSDVNDIKKTLETFDGVFGKDKAGADAAKKELKKRFYKILEDTDFFKNAAGPNPLKYELDEEKIYGDIDNAIGDMMARIKGDSGANAAITNLITHQGYEMSTPRFEFTVLSQLLSSEGQTAIDGTIKGLAHEIVDGLVPQKGVVIKGNITSLYKQVETAINDKLESRFATAKNTLESMGETAESETITELLKKYKADIKGAEEDPLIIKTMDSKGEIQYERVSPALADIYNERPTYSPMSTPMKVLNNLAVLKKINTTDLSPRSFAKQMFSDPAMAFTTVGALPGTLHAIRDEIAYHFGPELLRALENNDPIRFSNIKAISEREGISMEEAFARNSAAIAKAQVPFTLLNNELLRQANISKFGNEGALKVSRKNLNEKINSGLRKVSDKLGTPQNIRETYVRLYAGEKAYLDALRKGFNQEQAEMFREHALNTATTNFRTKHAVFNTLRSSVPYLTSGISGAKSFWQMFELDPIGVTSRIVTGFVIPILYFAGEIFSDENLKKKYEALAESEKENHIVIAVGGELILIPVGEEIGQYTNIIMHSVETIYNENKYDFWNLMLNDLIGLIPGADLTGFTDPEMLEPLSEEAPGFLEVMENGIAKVLASTAPPLAQSMILSATGRDLYTGRKIDTSYITIDEDGNPVIMSTSTSEFAKALAQVVGGDAKVIERAVSGTLGTVGIHVLDAITSAVQFVGSRGEEGSLTTAVDKALADISAPFAANGYAALERRFNYAVSGLFDEKEKIERDEKYIKYNQEISNEKDSKKRQNLINKRNELFANYLKKVEALVKGYKAAGGTLDQWNFSKVVSLITFEDAIRANRQFMDLNTNYSDARKQAMQTLYNMGITNPEGPSSLGYIYTDSEGKPQLKMWTPTQIQIMRDSFSEQGDIHAARIKAIINDGTENSLKKQKDAEANAEQPYWDKYNSTGKLSDDEWDAIDDLRKAYNAKVVLGLEDYMQAYGAANVLSNDAVMDYLEDVIKVPSAYETVKGRYVSSGGGKLNKQQGFAESYIKTIFGVK